MSNITATAISPVGRVRDRADQAYVVETTAGSVLVTPDAINPRVWACIDLETADRLPLEEKQSDHEIAFLADGPRAAAVDYKTFRAAFAN